MSKHDKKQRRRKRKAKTNAKAAAKGTILAGMQARHQARMTRPRAKEPTSRTSKGATRAVPETLGVEDRPDEIVDEDLRP